MIATIISQEGNPGYADISVVTSLDTFVGVNLSTLEVLAAISSVLEGQHPVFCKPVLPVEAYLDGEKEEEDDLDMDEEEDDEMTEAEAKEDVAQVLKELDRLAKTLEALL